MKKYTQNQLNDITGIVEDFSSSLDDLFIDDKLSKRFASTTVREIGEIINLLDTFELLKDTYNDDDLNATLRDITDTFQDMDTHVRDVLPRKIHRFIENIPQENYENGNGATYVE